MKSLRSHGKGQRIWRTVACAALCVAMLCMNMATALAVETSANTGSAIAGNGAQTPANINTGAPQGSAEPNTTGTPQATPEPDTTGTPQATPEPDNTGTPQASPEPDNTGAPQNDAKGGCQHQHTPECDPAKGAVCTHVCTVENGCLAAPQNPEVKSVTGWTWVDEEEILTEMDGEWYLALPSLGQDEPVTEELLMGFLPQEIKAVLPDGASVQLPVKWDFSALTGELAAGERYPLSAGLPEGYALKEGVKRPGVLFVFGGAELYAVYPGTRTVFASEAELDQALSAYTVHGTTPDGVTVNLFDYVASADGAAAVDLMPTQEFGGLKNVVPSSVWNQGINHNRLLLFGNTMIGGGYWNIGAGAGRQWARENTNMKGIVESVLRDGFPAINLAKARDPLINYNKYTGNALPYLLNRAENENADVALSNAPALSTAILQNAGGTKDPSGNWNFSAIDPSLSYLFDPDVALDGDVKRSKENVTGLFQMDAEGYYCYDARKNFAEFVQDSGGATSRDGRPSDGHFVLYDGGAVWRTDAGWDGSGFNGDMSKGNFYPFNTGKQVFDSLETKADGSKILSSTETLDSGKWTSAGGMKNQATNQNVLINHHVGMTMEVEFAQPVNGQINMGSAGKRDMIFEFSGDDDVWIFVDNVLVLDLGGVHSELYGTINFSTGEVISGQSWRTGGMPSNPGKNPTDSSTTLYDLYVAALGQDAADDLGWVTSTGGSKIFATGSDHVLKLFYLERGNYDSSLSLRFNLQPALYHSIQKVDQNGLPLEGVTFELYEARLKAGVTQESADVDDYETVGGAVATLVTQADGTANFAERNSEGKENPFSFYDRYAANNTVYYILKETQAVAGYRQLPKDIVIKFDPATTMLVVANRYQTGAYASFISNIRELGTLSYGQFDTGTGDIEPSGVALGQTSKRDGLIIAVPMLLQENMELSADTIAADGYGKWVALYGSNTTGLSTVIPAGRTAEEWRRAILKAALYQCSDKSWPGWYVEYNEEDRKLEGLLKDLPGRADRYALNNETNADMKMVYGVIEPYALEKIGVEGDTSAERYHALEDYVAGEIDKALKSPAGGKTEAEIIEATIDRICDALRMSSSEGDYDGSSPAKRGFSFLNTDQFQRDFRSIIYIPNERRELRVWKVDEDGKGINGVEFTLYKNAGTDGQVALGDAVVTGRTSRVDGLDGVLILTPDAQPGADGYAQVDWVETQSYVLKETSAPAGYEINPTKIPVIVGVYSIYADAGNKDDGVTVMAGVGKLMQTMTKYAADDTVNITLRDITAVAQVQPDFKTWTQEGWTDKILKGTTDIPRSMNLHYGRNEVVSYGLHDEDGGKNIYPFFTTDEGFLRTRVVQNTQALREQMYHGSLNVAKWDDLAGMDITSLFSQLNIVVVTDKKTTPTDTGTLTMSKTVEGAGLSREDYTENFSFKVELKDKDGKALTDTYYYYGEHRSGYVKDGDILSLRHDEALTILGLPTGTQWCITETQEQGWVMFPGSGIISGEIKKAEDATAPYRNYRIAPDLGDLAVTKTVAGDAGDTDKVFHFTVTLDDKTISGTFGDMKFTKGVATVELKHGQSKKAVGLLAGVKYTVTETEANQDDYKTTATGETGSLTKGATATAAFTNTKEKPVGPDPKLGNLKVSKTVSGSMGETNRDFTFTVTLGDTAVNGTYGDMTFAGGVATFTLRHGQSRTATGLPANIAYTVTESGNEGYAVTQTGATGTLAGGTTTEVKFNNRKGDYPSHETVEPTPTPTFTPTPTPTHHNPWWPFPPTDSAPKTGDETNLSLWLIVMGVSCIGAAATWAILRRRAKQRKD